MGYREICRIRVPLLQGELTLSGALALTMDLSVAEAHCGASLLGSKKRELPVGGMIRLTH